MRPTHWLQLSLLALVWLGGSMAWTGEPDLQQEVTDLKEQLRTQQQQIADLQRQVGTNPAPVGKEMQPGATTPGDSDSPPPAKADNDFRLKFSWENGAVGETEDKAFRVHFGGRFDFDSTWYRAPANVQLQLDNPLLDGTDFRRFRFETDGTVWKQIEFKLEADFSRGEDFKSLDTSSPQTNIFITDAWLAINDLPLIGTVRIGHQKEYMTFSNASSSNFYPFMERPYIFDAFEDDFSFDNGISMNRTYFDKQFTTWVGAFWTDTRSQAFNVGSQYAVTGRATWMPIDDETKQQWLNFGVSGSDRALASTGESISVRPLVRAGQSFNVPDLIDTATIFSADGLQILGAGLHGGWGPLTIGSEFLCHYSRNSFTGGLPNPNGTLPAGVAPVGDLFFSGCYVEVLCFLTPGDHQPVNRNIPGYGRVIPVRTFFCPADGSSSSPRGLGAWELGVRYDYVDVNSAQVQAGRLQSVTAGLNWYLNPNARITANYVFTSRSTGMAFGTGNFNALGLRAHFDF